jgi:aspartate/methionine/tyrosine aminotransferase
VDYFAELGILVTPGAFYGSDNYVRIALTATDKNIKQVVDRIKI